MVDPGTASLIGTGVSSAASLLGGISANQGSKSEGRRSRRWQKKMYQNRYQYAAADMKKAGINPILAAGTPPPTAGSAAQAQIQNPVPDKMGTDAALAYSTAQQAQSQAIENTRQKRLDKLLYSKDLIGDVALITDYSKTAAGAAAGTAKAVNAAAKAAKRSKGFKGLTIGIGKGRSQKTRKRSHFKKGNQYSTTKGGAWSPSK